MDLHVRLPKSLPHVPRPSRGFERVIESPLASADAPRHNSIHIDHAILAIETQNVPADGGLTRELH